MCLAIPGEIQEIDGDEARAEFWDVEKWVRLDLVGDTVSEGDYILNHAGFAIRKLPEDQVEQTLAVYESFLEGDEDDALEEIGAPDADLGLGGGAGEAAERGETGPGPATSGRIGTNPGPLGAGIDRDSDGNDVGRDSDGAGGRSARPGGDANG